MDTLDLNQFSDYLVPRERNSHKGDFGRVLVIGGDYGFSGAPRMAAEAALRVGAGLVSVATHPEHAAVLNVSRPEIMCHGVRSANKINGLLDKANVVAIGPGLGTGAWGQELLDYVLKSGKTIVADADALNILAEKDQPIKRENWVLTPHPGEAGRLLKITSQNVQCDRNASAIKLQQIYGGVVVLKGAGSIIVAPNEQPVTCEHGNPGMATAGMGDVLTGVIAGLIAQQIPISDAAKLGVLIHAMAGDMAAEEGGERGMLAMDLMPFLRKLMNTNE